MTITAGVTGSGSGVGDGDGDGVGDGVTGSGVTGSCVTGSGVTGPDGIWPPATMSMPPLALIRFDSNPGLYPLDGLTPISPFSPFIAWPRLSIIRLLPLIPEGCGWGYRGGTYAGGGCGGPSILFTGA